MSNPVDALILNLLEWVGPNPRPYSEVIEAWRTSCPRLPVWEEANERGFLDHRHEPGRGTFVSVSAEGAVHLREHRRQAQDRLSPNREREPKSGVISSREKSSPAPLAQCRWD